MNLAEIKQALSDGKCVYWNSKNYKIKSDHIGQLIIHCALSEARINLINTDGETLNGKAEDFYIEDCKNDKDELFDYKGVVFDGFKPRPLALVKSLNSIGWAVICEKCVTAYPELKHICTDHGSALNEPRCAVFGCLEQSSRYIDFPSQSDTTGDSL